VRGAEQHVHGLDVAVQDGRHTVVVQVRDGVGDAQRHVVSRAPLVRARRALAVAATAVEEPAQATVGDVAVEQQPRAAVQGPAQQPHDVAVADGAQCRDLAAERRLVGPRPYIFTARVYPLGVSTLYTTPELPVPITFDEVSSRSTSSMVTSSFWYSVTSHAPSPWMILPPLLLTGSDR
jgi:hypothetical protein